jgi:tRNA A-37 threonylcarbamoyl transferase component Bud32
LSASSASANHTDSSLAAEAPSPPDKTVMVSAADAAPAPVGTKVRYLGDYELLEEIALGGMGIVYKARQVSLNRTVAVKMILAGQLAGEAEVRRFRTEAEAAANLQHPHIVAIHEIGQHQGQHYFSMDYVQGPNLAQWAKSRTVSPPEAARLVLTVARAVHFAHQRGTLHRDLKPHNILIDEAGQPHITDFGLAKRATQSSQLTQEGAVLGSPSYMSPEQALGRQDLVGPASDVYALGAILYELLTGRPPFGPGPFGTVLRQVVEEEPVAPSRGNRLVPVALETICLKCLEKWVERRYAMARDLAEELERFLNCEPILARPAGPVRKAWGWLVRNPWLLVGATTALMLGLVGLAYGLWEQNRYLVWTHAHPATAKGNGPAELLGLPFLILPLLASLGSLLCFIDFVDRKRYGLALGPRRLWLFAGLGTFFVLGAIAFTLAGIHDWIWVMRSQQDSNKTGMFLFAVSVCAWFGGLLLFHVAREFRIRSLGLRSANEEELFPPAPRESKPTLAMRSGINFVVLTVVVWAWLLRFLFPDGIGRQMGSFAGLSAMGVPIGLACYRLMRKSAIRHYILLITAMCLLFSLMLLKPMAGWDQDTQRRALTMMIGLGLGIVWAIGLTHELQVGKAGFSVVPEEAWFEWWFKCPSGSGLLVLFSMIAIVALAALLGGLPVQAPLVAIILLMTILPHEIACWWRSRGRERQGRGYTVVLIVISALSAAYGFPLALSSSGAGVGMLLGVGILAFLYAKSKR